MPVLSLSILIGLSFGFVLFLGGFFLLNRLAFTGHLFIFIVSGHFLLNLAWLLFLLFRILWTGIFHNG